MICVSKTCVSMNKHILSGKKGKKKRKSQAGGFETRPYMADK